MPTFIALAVVERGSLIKIPSPVGTVAMDSCPGFFSAASWGYLKGGIVIALGHLITAATVGFPLGVTRILIAVLMVVAAMILRVCITKLPQKAGINVVVGVIAAATFNGVQAIFLPPLLGWGLAYT